MSSNKFKFISREYKKDNTIVEVEDIKIGGNEIIIMAGPCSVESSEQVFEIAQHVKNAGAKILRGGAFKPRTSPYSFQGLGEDGLKILQEAKNRTSLKIITEVIDVRDVELISKYADIIQIGTRNMYNYKLLTEVGMSNKPILLKRNFAATIEEWLFAAEYIMNAGNKNIILCERGIRTFTKSTRNTLDISSIPVVKKLSHLPIIIDPSHASGYHDYVPALSKAAIAAGADGLIIEVHNNPTDAVSDSQQSLKLKKFTKLMNELQPIANAINRNL